ncbi:DNA repair protein rhp54, partial [Aureobasidium melanogenum]
MYRPFKSPLLTRPPGSTPQQVQEPTSERPTKRLKVSPQQPEHDGNSSDTVCESPERPSDDPADARFSVLWRKITNKKNKIWDGDGILIVSQGYANLKDSDGKDIGRTVCKTPLLPGSTLSMSGKEIEIDSRISREEARSMLPQKKPPKPTTTKTSIVTRPSVPVARTPLRPVQTQSKPTSMLGKAAAAFNSAPKVEAPPRAVSMLTKPTAAFKSPMIDKTGVPLSRSKSDGKTVCLPRHDPNEPNALVMKRPKHAPDGKHIVDVVVDPNLTKHLREHQRAGVAFLYECIMGMRPFDGEGAILADEMGLGKTLQTIALIWTLLKQNPIYEDGPVIKKALIVCPVTLINNWRKEFKKWLGNEKVGVMVAENNKTRLSDFTKGKSYNILIIGYEKLRNVQEELQQGLGVDIVIADEGHRLKTANNKSAAAIKSLNTERRIILSGTPIQNDLSEFFTMVDFVNPGLLKTYSSFKKQYETPILKSRTPGATAKDIEKGQTCSEELASITGQFILRRTAEILSKYLPPKTEYVVYCRPTRVQKDVYEAVVSTGVLNQVLKSNEAAFQMINILKKLCNSPSLLKNPSEGEEGTVNSLLAKVPASDLKAAGGSSKLQVLDDLLHFVHTMTQEKIVVVSNYTATLDMIGKLLTALEYSFLRLDGSTPANQRQGLVDKFNRTSANNCFVFLLSAKAGGVGLNLIGASRLVLFDIDWNPATDLQAMGRVHRDGQKHPVHIYRFLTKGALEEKIFQRQLTKQGLADSIVDNKANASSFTPEELREIFTLDSREGCQTHELMGCDCPCDGSVPISGSSSSPTTTSASGAEDEEGDEAEDEEEMPALPSFLRSSQIDPETQERLRRQHHSLLHERLSPKKKGSGSTKDDKVAMASLMQFSHLDAVKLRHEIAQGNGEVDGEEEDGIVAVKEKAEDAVQDVILRALVTAEKSRIDFVFAKTSG